MSKHEDFEYIRNEWGNFSFINDTGKRKDYLTSPKIKKWVKTIIRYGDKVYNENSINTDIKYKKYQKLIEIYNENHRNLIPKLSEILKIYSVVFPTLEMQWNEKPNYN